MCGIAGIIVKQGSSADAAEGKIRGMTDALLHRGPDAGGVYVDREAGLYLGHRRLAILDLTEAGAQPMISPDGRFVIVFNGEIYNHTEVRSLVAREAARAGAGIRWRGASDTETLLAALEHLGPERTLNECSGMFAFAFYDTRLKELVLARDRFGEKPLYYYSEGGTFAFASEIKALRFGVERPLEIDRGAISAYLQLNYVPAPISIYKNVRKLRPGHVLRVTAGGLQIKESAYYNLLDQISLRRSVSSKETMSMEHLDFLLRRSVREQMLSDVPIGAFLSGGIDSSLIVSYMAEASAGKVKTYSIGFHEREYDEAGYARQMAKHIGTDHSELYVTAAEAAEVIPRLPSIYCEPFSDASQIPTYLVSALARKSVTVALSGDAGDELFGGYNRYLAAEKLLALVRNTPRLFRSTLNRVVDQLEPGQRSGLLSLIAAFLPQSYRSNALLDKLKKIGWALDVDNERDLYYRIISNYGGMDGVLSPEGNAFSLQNVFSWPDMGNSTESFMATDTLTYLPDDILVKVDRAAMSVSLETRVPFLDYRVVEYAWSIPIAEKIRRGVTKAPLRELLYKRVPREMVDRPKMGFGVPIEKWLCGPLKGWAEDMLSENRLRDQGVFAPDVVRSRWKEHLNRERNWHRYLWSVLVFNTWLEGQR